MKKLFLSIYVFFYLVILAHAQNSSPYWSLTGNSNATSSSKLGTTNAINLRLFTSNLERIRITSSGLVGVGTTAPTSKFQINSTTSQDPLRVQVNGTTKLFAHRSGGLSVGSASTPPANGLYVSGNVGLGTNTPSYKLHVVGGATITQGLYVQDYGTASYNYAGSWGTYSYGSSGGTYSYGPTYGVYASGTASSGSYGVYATGGTYGVYGSRATYGLYGNSSNGYGVRGISSSTGVFGSGSFGIYGSGSNTGTYGTGSSYGIYGYSSSGLGASGISSSNYGVYGASSSGIGGYFSSTSSHGIWARTLSTAANYYAGVFEGKVYTYNSYHTSDKNLKKNIQEFGDAMSILNKLKPRKYEFRDDGKYASLRLPQGNHYGLIAQDLEQILPNLVSEAPLVVNLDTKTNNEPKVIKPTADGSPAIVSEEPSANQQQGLTEILNTKAVNYTELIPLIIKGMQEQDLKIQEQAAKIVELTELVHKMSQNLNTTGTLKPTGTSYMSNPYPTPSQNIANISYTLPANSDKAELVIYDASGKKVRQIALNNSGSIEINTATLSAGSYSCVLFIKGVSVETRRMLIEKP